VTGAGPLLDRTAIEEAFRRLGDQLARLRVAAASPEHLLAMKVLAGRRRDSDDIRFLIQRLGLTSLDQVLAICADVFPDEPVPDRARLILEDALEEGHLPDQGKN